MAISIYTLGFNLVKNKYPWIEALHNYIEFLNEKGDELVISIDTNLSDDDTFRAVEDFFNNETDFKNYRIIETKHRIDDPEAIGKIKDDGLQACSNEILLQLDMDERVAARHRPLFNAAGDYLLSQPNLKALFVPVVNLYKNYEEAYDLSFKWYLHKKSGCYRGAVNFGKVNGKIDIKKSDACELIDRDGNLVPYISILPATSQAHLLAMLQSDEYPFVYHLGYALGETRADSNKFFNKHLIHFDNYELKPETVSVIESEKESFEHKLKLWHGQ